MAETFLFTSRRKQLALLSLVGTLLVTYPNVVWIPTNLSLIGEEGLWGFWGFFAFRMAYFYALLFIQLCYNVTRIRRAAFGRRLASNLLFTACGCLIFAGLSLLLSAMHLSSDYVGNILIFQFVVECLLCVFMGSQHELYERHLSAVNEVERLKVENLRSRCAALVHQINPHFFFNSLNGVASLIRRGDSEAALSYVNALSEVFRYILRSDRSTLATLREELAFVSSFMHVMEVRFARKLQCVIDVPPEAQEKKLPVLSLLPLLENVTVHNMIDSKHKMLIRIFVNGEGVLEISNPLYPRSEPAETHGTGLHNLRSRFSLILNRDIQVEQDDKTFRVLLPLI